MAEKCGDFFGPLDQKWRLRRIPNRFAHRGAPQARHGLHQPEFRAGGIFTVGMV